MLTSLLRLLLVIAVPLCISTQSVIYPQIPIQKSLSTTNTKQYHAISYDNMLDLLQKLEEEDFEEQCSPADLERIHQFLIHLAKQGLLEQNSEEELALAFDIQELLGNSSEFHNCASDLYQNMTCAFMPDLFYEQGNIVLCKGWLRKQCGHIKKFVKKHKKEILIGAAVVVATTIVICIVTACPAATAPLAAAGAGISGSNKSDDEDDISYLPTPQEIETIEAVLETQIPDFKEIISEDRIIHDLELTGTDDSNSLRENIRIVGSALAHNIFDETAQLLFTTKEEGSERNIAHKRIDSAFGTDQMAYYGYQTTNFPGYAYQARGDHALETQHYEQAVHDFGKLIELNPTNPEAYLSRASTYYAMGEYNNSLQDYQTYIEQKPLASESIIGVPSHFAKGLAIGVWESGKGLVSFTASCLAHPINTMQEVWESLTTLVNLTKTEEWAAIGQAVAPEAHHLLTEWDTLSAQERAELAGQTFGKLGGDILIPEATGKVFTSGIKGTKELAKAAKCLKNAEKTVVLETLAESSFGKANVLRENPWPLKTIDPTTAAALQRGIEKFKFSHRAAIHMTEEGRWVPVNILEDVINSPIVVTLDPRGLSNGLMHYSQISRNGKLYNIEVLYDKATNTIEHFLYDDGAMGPLKKVKKNG
ncbi:MAG: tetratricopeptide repeat protein [Chlamydiales bacterium]